MTKLLRRLSYLLHQRRIERDLAEEIDSHRRMHQARLERDGVTPIEATTAARRAMGNTTLAREDARAVWIGPWIDALWHDVTYSLRTLRKNPGFSALAIVTIALGIGANSAMFSLVNGVVLRPLPYRDPGRLAMLWIDDPKRNLHENETSSQLASDWRHESRLFEDMAIFTPNVGVMTASTVAQGFRLRQGSGGPAEASAAAVSPAITEPERIRSAFASANLFQVLGVSPAMGRTFSPEEEARADRVAVIAYGLWQRRFGGSADAIGGTFTIAGDQNANKLGPRTIRIIGVMPQAFSFPDKDTAFWEPATVYWRWQNESHMRYGASARRWHVIGRLRPDARLAAAQAEMTAIGERLARMYPVDAPDFPGPGVNVVPVLDSVTGRSLQRALWILFGAVLCVLLIACANVANLLLARGATRQRELAIRAALGAGRARLIRQLLLESALVASIGGALGLWLGAASLRALVSATLAGLPRVDEIQIDRTVLAFTAAISIGSGLLFGLAPARRFSRVSPNDVLKDGGGSTSGRVRRTRGLLVLVECALALVLVAGSGLLIRSLLRVHAVEPGFNPDGVLLLRTSLAPGLAPTVVRAGDTGAAMFALHADIYERMVARLAALPNVRGAAATTNAINRDDADVDITVEGQPEGHDNGQIAMADVSPTYFQTLGVPLLRGRAFTRADVARKICLFFLDSCGLRRSLPPALEPGEPTIVNRAFADRFFPDADPIGKRFYIGQLARKHYWYEIVGVVGDMRRQGLETRAVPEYFGQLTPVSADLVVRVDGDPLAASAMVRDLVRSVDPHVMVLSVTTLADRLNEFTAPRRLQTGLLSLFAALALSLSAIGLFGLVRYAVVHRAREIGVRIALGATRHDVMRLIVGDSMRLPLAGIAIGIAAALGLTRVLRTLLFEIDATDPATFGTAALLLLTVALVACYMPARAAARTDPVRTLHCE